MLLPTSPKGPFPAGAVLRWPPTGVDAVVMEHFGVDVAIAQLQISREIIVLERDDAASHGPGSAVPFEKGTMTATMTARCLRHLRNSLSGGRQGKALLVATRTRARQTYSERSWVRWSSLTTAPRPVRRLSSSNWRRRTGWTRVVAGARERCTSKRHRRVTQRCG